MANIVIDVRGLSCPEPVVQTKKAFEKNTSFDVIVDNETSKENVIRFCEKMKADVKVSSIDDGWRIEVSK